MIANYLGALAAGAEAHGARCPAQRVPRSAQPAASARRRTCATARTRTRARPSTATPQPAPGALGHCGAAAGQGAVVQQHRRCRRGLGVRQDLRRAGLRDRQARQPVRRGARRDRWPRPTPRPSRPTRPRPSAASSPSTGRSTRRRPQHRRRKQFVEVLIAPGYRDGGARGASPASTTCACSRCRCRRRRNALRLQARRRRPAGADSRQPNVLARRAARRDEARAHRGSRWTTCCSRGRWPSSSRATPSCSAPAA